MKRKRIAATLALVALAMGLFPVSAPAIPIGSYQDFFDSGTYGGDNGSLSWESDWTETGESNGASTGSAEIATEPHCPLGGADRCLILGKGGLSDVDAGVWRQADLSGADTVTLVFWYNRHPHGSGQGYLRLSVSPDAGSNWHDLVDYPLNVDDLGAQLGVIDITNWATSTSRIRFELFNSSSDDSHMNIDWLQIWLDVSNVAPTLDPIGDQAAPEGLLSTFTATATDPDLPPNRLTFTLAGTVPAGAAIDPSTGVFTWTSTETQDGSHTFDVVVTDDGVPVKSDSETITVTVGETNRAPTLGPVGDRSIDEESLLSFTATAADPDLPANSLTYSLNGAPAGATIDPVSGVFTWTPNEAQDGAHTFDIAVTDDGTPALTDSKTITITVGETNQAPTLDPVGNRNVDEGSPLVFTATASDPDDPANLLTFTLNGAPAGATIDPLTGAFSWTPTETQHGSQTFDIVVTDSGTPRRADSETITVTVNEINRAPVLGPVGNRTVDETAPLTFTATASDPDDPANLLTFSLSGSPAGAAIDSLTGAFSWTPTEAQDGAHTFDVAVTDNGSPVLADSETITVTVNEINRAPVLGPVGNRVVDETTPLSFTAAAGDPDLPTNALSYSLGGAVPVGAAINPGSGAFTWTPTEAQDGTHTFDVLVTDSGGPALSDFETITVTVNETNVAPTLTHPGNQTSGEGDTVTLPLTATDPDVPVNTLTYSAVRLPTGLTIDPASGLISGTVDPIAGLGSPYVVDVTVTDDGNPVLQDQVSFVWIVTDTNRSPILDPVGDKSGTEQAVLSFTATASDPDGDGWTFSLADGASGSVPAGAAISPTGDFTWTPAEIHHGVHTFDVIVTDDGIPALGDFETITVTVTESNQPPVLSPVGNKAVTEANVLSFTATAADPDIPTNGLAFSLTGAPSGAGIDPVSGAFTWTPTEAQDGTHTFDIVVTDNGSPAMSDSETITVTVNEGPNRPPALDPIGNKVVAEGSALTFTATAGDLDVPANALSFSLSGAPGGASIDPTSGAFIWTPTETQHGSHTFDIVVTDDGTPNLSDSKTITVSVVETNRAPTLTNPGNQTSAEGDSIALPLIATDPDVPANGLSYTADRLPPGLAIDPATGIITGTIDPIGSLGSPYAVTVTVNDDGIPTLQDETSFIWYVTHTNRSPILDLPSDVTADEETLIQFTAIARDPDPGDTLTFGLDGAPGAIPAGATISPTGAFSWTPHEVDGPGSFTFKIVVTDNGTPELSDRKPITITVREKDQPPTITHPGDQTDHEGASIDRTIVASDPDIPAQTVTLAATGLPPGLSLDPATGQITGTIAVGSAAASPYTVSITASDGGTAGGDAGVTFRWWVTVPNLAPTGADTAFTTQEDTPFDAQLTAVDPDGDAVSLIIHDSPSLGTVTVNGTRIRYEPTPGVSGTDEFRYVVSDGSATSRPYTVTIEIEHVNGVPVATDDRFETTSGETMRIGTPGVLANDTDPEGDPLHLRVVTDPSHGELTLAGDGSLTYRPADGFVGADQFTYQISDPSGGRSTATAYVTVMAPPTVPGTSSATRSLVVDQIVAAGPDIDDTAETGRFVQRSLVLMSRAARTGVQQMGFPLALLLVSLFGVLSLGRVSVVPLIRRGERHSGTVHTYDPAAGYGLLVRDDDAAEVFVHRVALPRRLRATLAPGDAVDFFAIRGTHRDVAHKVRLRR
jgi:cold shock CspA family protein